jgi:hypothetical protein
MKLSQKWPSSIRLAAIEQRDCAKPVRKPRRTRSPWFAISGSMPAQATNCDGDTIPYLDGWHSDVAETMG